MENFLNSHTSELISSLIAVVVLYLTRLVFVKLTNKKVDDPIRRYFFIQTAGYIVIVAGVVILSMIWVEWIRSVVTFFSLVVGALVITAKELILSLAANLVIFWRGLFSVGDRITIGNHSGDVIELGAFYITLAEIENSGLYTGRVVKVPNNVVTTQIVINHSKSSSLIWNMLQFKVSEIIDFDKTTEFLTNKLNDLNQNLNEDDYLHLMENHSDLMFSSGNPKIMLEPIDDGIIIKLSFVSKLKDAVDKKNELYATVLKASGEGYYKLIK